MDLERLGEQLSAYLDGELSEQERALVERALREDAGAQRLLDELRRMTANVESLPRHAAPDSILEDVRFQLERSELLGDFVEDGGDRGGRGIGGIMRWAMAATFGIAAIGALWALMEQYEPTSPEQVALRSRSEVGGGRAEPEERLAMVEEKETPRTRAKEMKITKRRRRGTKTRDVGDQSLVPTDVRPRTMGKPAAVAGSPSEKRANDPGSPRRLDAIADTRDVDAKLAQGLTADGIRRHTFGNETVRLEIRARDEATRERIERQLVTTLASRHVVDLDTENPDAKPTRFYYRGRADVNYDGSGRRQVLVRAHVGEIEAMLGELGYGGPGTPDDVTLVVDKFRFQGRREARETLRRLVPKDEPVGEEAQESGPVAALPVTDRSRSGGAVERLARGFGVDPNIFKDAHVFMDLDTPSDRDSPDGGGVPRSKGPVAERDEGATAMKRSGRQAGVVGAEGKKGATQAKAIDGEAGREHVAVLKDRPTLVDRRIAAMEKGATQAQEAAKRTPLREGHADAHMQDDTSPTAGVIGSADKRTEPFITLVVDLILPEPTKPTTAKRGAAKAKRKPNIKTPRKTTPKNPNAKTHQ